jgi:hypothetical protein
MSCHMSQVTRQESGSNAPHKSAMEVQEQKGILLWIYKFRLLFCAIVTKDHAHADSKKQLRANADSIQCVSSLLFFSPFSVLLRQQKTSSQS